MDILFVRHGQTDWNLNDRLQGSSDIPLNSQGIAQAHELSRKLRGLSFPQIYSSPLARARQTVQLLRPASPICLEPRLRERAYGAWEGFSVREFRVRAAADPHFLPEQAESREQVEARVRDFLFERLRRPASSLLLVSHGGVFSALLRGLFGLSREEARHHRIENCGAYLVRFEAGHIELVKGSRRILRHPLPGGVR